MRRITHDDGDILIERKRKVINDRRIKGILGEQCNRSIIHLIWNHRIHTCDAGTHGRGDRLVDLIGRGVEVIVAQIFGHGGKDISTLDDTGINDRIGKRLTSVKVRFIQLIELN